MSGPAEQNVREQAAQLDQAAVEAAREVYERQLRVAAGVLAAAIRGGLTDGAETISHLLATVAANLGGMHTLTADRPGSWEARHVDQFLASTVGPDGEYLLAYRTEPIEVVECVDAVMADMDIAWLYDESYELIDAAEDDAYGDNETLADAAGERVAQAEELLHRLQDRDYAAYRAAFEQRVRSAGDELRRSRQLPESVEVRVRWVEWADREQTTGAQQAWGTVECEVWEIAREQTPPPGFTEPLAQIHRPRTPGEILRAAGRMPHQRIPELAHYIEPASEPPSQPHSEPPGEPSGEPSAGRAGEPAGESETGGVR
jgi:hypothetical protein